MKWLALTLAMGMAAMTALSQTRVKKPTFEVASIKRDTNSSDSNLKVDPGGRLIATNRALSDLIFHAYNLRPYQIPDMPEWIHSAYYDVEAKGDGNLSWDEVMPMLQSLLEDRFRLKVHWSTKEQPVFFITVAKGGIKLKPSIAACARFDPGTAPARTAEAKKALPTCRDGISGRDPRRYIAENSSMNSLTYNLSYLLGRKVIDMTGFTGRFDFDLEFAGDPLKAGELFPTLITVLQDELGLKVESGRAPVDVLVIDYVETPSQN
jgi:uncharacterized protein (TIGR03435 family)